MSDGYSFGSLAPASSPEPEVPGQRPLVGGGLRNALAMLLQSSPVVKAQNYGSQLVDAAKLPGDLYSGRQPSYLGLRREDFTDDPNAPDPNEHLTRGAVSLADAMSMGSMPVAAISGAEHGAFGIGVPPKIHGQGGPKIPTIGEANAPVAANRNAGYQRTPGAAPEPANTNPRWGDLAQTNQKTGAALSAIADALKYAPDPAPKDSGLLSFLRNLLGKE